MKDSTKVMNILESFDLYQSYNQTARACNCSPNTVKALVLARKNGTLSSRGLRQSSSSIFSDTHTHLIRELVEASSGSIRADVVHQRLVGLEYKGSQRTTRRAVHKEKAKYRRDNARIYWPWVAEAGKWAQYDFSDGPVIDGKKTTLFHYYLPHSKYRVVLHIPDQSLPNVIGALHTCFALTGGVPQYVLTDNAKTAATSHVANVAVLNATMVKFACSYGFALKTCVPYDPASKGGVERAVRVAKEHLCPKDTNLVENYQSITQLKDAIDSFNIAVNAKVHSSSGKVPALVLSEEQAMFSPLPKTPYLAAYGVMRKVETNMAIVRYLRCGYSVPPEMRGRVVHVRQDGDEVVVTATSESAVVEVARHQRGEPYEYVISDKHKDSNHPSGPLLRRPVPTNEREAKFLGISSEAAVWLENAASRGTKGITESITALTLADKGVANRVIAQCLELDDFAYDKVKALIDKGKEVKESERDSEVEYLGSGTSPYAKLKAVS